MKKQILGKTGYEIGRVVYGGIVSANLYGDTVMPGDGQKDSDRYVSWAVERGVNYFDVAPSYGNAEEMLGNSLLPYRKQVYLACKTGLRDAERAEKELLRSLSRLHTDYFDVYQLHAVSSLEFVKPLVAISKNCNVKNSPYNQLMFEREARVLEILIADELLK